MDLQKPASSAAQAEGMAAARRAARQAVRNMIRSPEIEWLKYKLSSGQGKTRLA
jgi:hypothetical protein